MAEFVEMAQDFVEATSLLIGGRTINIMDLDGVIIASSERHRINNFHQGAAEVIKTGKMVLIHSDNLEQYPGAKEGYNMPIFLKDQMLGVIGVYGCEEEVQNVANLLGVYVTQHFAQKELAQKQKLESEIRMQLLRLLILGDEQQIETISQLESLLDVQIGFPLRVIMISCQEKISRTEQMSGYTKLIQNLIWHGILDRKRDIYGMQKDDYVVLMGIEAQGAGNISREQRLLEIMEQENSYRISASSLCSKLEDIPNGMKEVSVLKTIKGGIIQDIEKNQVRVQYLFQKALMHGGERHAIELYHKLLGQEEQGQVDLLLMTAGVYYQEQGHVTVASGRLHIHKNTLHYRLKRLFQLMNLEQETSFAREFLVRLILQERQIELPS